MSETRLVLNLDEIRAGLRELLDSVSGTGEAAHIVEARANGAMATITAGYPARVGAELRTQLTVTHTRNPFGARSVIRNTAPEALWFEEGTQARHTTLGANRGTMPANHLFTQTIMRERRGMHEDHRTLLERLGLTVTGDA